MATHHAAGPLAFGDAHHVDQIAGREHVGLDLLAELVGPGVVGPQLHEVRERLVARLVEVALPGLRDVARPQLAVRELNGVVAVGGLVRICVTTHGPALITVTGTARVSTKIWVMPSFSPTIPLVSVIA